MKKDGGNPLLAATGWSIAATYLDRAMRFGVFVVVSRLVSPGQFGIVLISLLTIETLQIFLDAGLAKALIQQATLSKPQVDAAFAVVVAINLVAAVSLFLGASAIGRYSGEPQLAGLIRALSVIPLISGAAQVQMALLQRDMKFRTLATRTIFSSLLGSLVAIGLAMTGEGRVALVARAIVQAVCGATLVWMAMSYRPSLRVDLRALRPLLPMGLRLWVANIATLVNARGFDVLAGLFLGAAALGALRIAGQTVLLMIELTLTPLMSVGFAALARHQDDAAMFEKSLVDLAGLAALLIFPSFAGLLVVADPLLPLVFGSRWTLAAAITPFMCIIAPALYWQVLFTAACMAAGRTNRLLTIAFLEAGLTVAFGLIGSRFGLVGLAAAGSLRLYVLIPVTWRWLKLDTGIDPVALLRPALPSVAAALGMLFVLAGIKGRLTALLGPTGLTMTLVGLGIVAYAILLPLASKLLRQPLTVALPKPFHFRFPGSKLRAIEKL